MKPHLKQRNGWTENEKLNTFINFNPDFFGMFGHKFN